MTFLTFMGKQANADVTPAYTVESVLTYKAPRRRVNAPGHGTEEETSMHEQPTPVGLCQCGCGKATSRTPKGPRRFIWGHCGRPRRDVETRFWEKVATDGPLPGERPELGPCWQWTSGLNRYGYGCFWLDGKREAYRVAYELVMGPIPAGLHIDHLCRNRVCVNPGHMETVVPGENTRRGDRSTLSFEKARAIRRSTESDRALAQKYGVHTTTIRDVRAHRRWVED